MAFREKELKSVGKLNWKEADKQGLYNKTLILDRVPSGNVAEKPEILEASNSKQGIKFEIELDRDYLKEKVIRHFLQFFKSKQDAIEFLEETWEYRQKKILLESLGLDLNTIDSSKIDIAIGLLQELKNSKNL
jgi:hypothetical protein